MLSSLAAERRRRHLGLLGPPPLALALSSLCCSPRLAFFPFPPFPPSPSSQQPTHQFLPDYHLLPLSTSSHAQSILIMSNLTSGAHQPSSHRSHPSTTTTASSPAQTPFPFIPLDKAPFSIEEDSLLLRMLVTDCPPKLYPKAGSFAWRCNQNHIPRTSGRCNLEIRSRIEELLNSVRDGEADFVVVPRVQKKRDEGTMSRSSSSCTVKPLSASSNVFQPLAHGFAVNGKVDWGRFGRNRGCMAQQESWQEGQVRNYLAAQLHSQQHPSNYQGGEQQQHPFDFHEPLLSSPSSTPCYSSKQGLPTESQQRPRSEASPQLQPQVQAHTQSQQPPHGHPYYGVHSQHMQMRSGSSSSVWPRGGTEIGAIGTWPQGLVRHKQLISGDQLAVASPSRRCGGVESG